MILFKKFILPASLLFICSFVTLSSEEQTKTELPDFRVKRPLYKHAFYYNPNADSRNPENVYLSGSFNGDMGQPFSQNPMTKDGSGIYKIEIELPEGVFQYSIKLNLGPGKNVLFDDKLSSRPELRTLSVGEDNPTNAFYSGPEPSFKYDNREYLGQIRLDIYSDLKALHDNLDLKFFSFIPPSLTRVMCRITENTTINAYLYYRSNPDQEWKKASMEKIISFSGWDFYSVTLNNLLEGQILYFFEFDDSVTSVALGNGIFGTKKESANQPFIAQLKNSPTTPQWAYDAIWYEIFPDRFRNGNFENDPPGTLDAKHWPDRSELEIANIVYGWSVDPGEKSDSGPVSEVKLAAREEQRRISNDYKDNLNRLTYGGDFQGLLEALPYLEQLGVNSLYLTPIFSGRQSHHYHTLDPRHIDDSFGYKESIKALKNETDDPETWEWSKSDLLFLNFIKEAHKRGFKIILDINLHSMHKESFWFKDILKNRQKSPYADWFNVYDWGADNKDIQYWAWDKWVGGSEMPVFMAQKNLNYAPSLNAFLLAIIKRWLLPNGDPDAGVDGFRIDSPDAVPIFFLWDLHDFIKMYKPEALLIAENWHQSDLSNLAGLFNGEQDMEWAENIYHFFIGKKKSLPIYLKYLNTLFSFGSLPNIMSSWHQVDNHDTIRLISSINNPKALFHPPLYKYYEVNEPTALDWKRFYQIITFQFTCFGAPLIYYGDEVGMWSGSDPLNRGPMLWQDLQGFTAQNVDVLNFYKRIIALRAHLTPLRRGDFQSIPLDEKDGLFGFLRSTKDDQLIVVFNRSAEEKSVTIPAHLLRKGTRFIDYLNPNQIGFIESPNRTTKFYLNDKEKGYERKDGDLKFTIEPWGSLILKNSEDLTLPKER